MFLSQIDSGIDAKKRVSVPASFRRALEGDDRIFIWPSQDEPCLEGGGRALVEKYQRAMLRLRPRDKKRRAISYAIFGQGRYARFDEGGRIVLDADLLAHAGITDKVRFVGFGDSFQIWSPERHDPVARELLALAKDAGDLLEPFGDDGSPIDTGGDDLAPSRDPRAWED